MPATLVGAGALAHQTTHTCVDAQYDINAKWLVHMDWDKGCDVDVDQNRKLKYSAARPQFPMSTIARNAQASNAPPATLPNVAVIPRCKREIRCMELLTASLKVQIFVIKEIVVHFRWGRELSNMTERCFVSLHGPTKSRPVEKYCNFYLD